MLSQYQFTTTTASSIQDIINALGDPMITPVQVVTPNQSVPAILNTGANIALNNILYQVKSGDSFANIAANFNAQGALSSEGQPLQASDIAAANLGSTGIFTLNTPVVFSTDDITNPNRITYTTQTGDTLNTIAARLLVRAAPASLLQQFVNLNQFMLAIINANQGVIPNPDGTLNPGTELNIPDPTDPAQTGIYTTVAGDTFTLVAAYFLGVQQQVVSYPGFVTEILALNTLQITDPTQPQNVGTILIIPPLTHNLQAADTINSLAITLITTPSIIQAWLLGATGSLLAPQSVLNMPALQYKIATADSLGSIAQKFNLSLTQLAKDLMEPLNPQDPTTVPKIFAASVNVIINDVETINVQTLMNALLNQGEWNNIAGMVSRFLLNGLRLPDPTDPYFASLTVEQLENPTGVDFTRIVTQPMYALTGQQFAISTGPPPSNITIQNSDPVSWILSGSGDEFTEMQIDLSAYQQLISELADTPLDPQIQSLTRLELFQMAPPRFTLQQQMHWQAALLPSSPCFGRSAQATGGPSLWLFPDALITHLTSGADEDLKYELVVGTHQDATVPMVISDVSCYNWATIVNLTISLPQVDGSTPPAIANSYVMLGADENGRELLQELYVYLTQTNKSDKATLYLLYSPNPSSTNSSGLISDKLDPNQTYLLKTNLSTLSQSGPQSAPKAMAAPGDTDDLYDATLSDPANFIKLLWECSIVYSGGYYLNYVNADGNAGLPGELFAQGQTATLSLLIMLESQGLSALPPIYSFNNCVVVGDNIDASQSNIFVQPVVYVVPQGDSLTSVVSDYNANSGSSLTVVQFATFNENVTPLLLVGAALEIKGQSQSYTIGVGDTLAGIAKKFNTDVTTLVETGNNAQAPILTRGLRANLSDSGGPNPVTEPVPAGDSLTDAANFYNTNFGGNVTASDVAMLNADVPLLLLMGAQLQITGKPNYEIQYGDTLSSIAKEFQTDVATLVAMGHNVSAAILAPGAQAQFNQGVLQPSAAVPQGNVGFKLTRPNPDPYNLPWAQLSPQQIVASLFHLLRYSIATTAQTQDTPGFVASGLGLPTGPSNSSQAGTSGVTPGEQLDGVELEWYYQQTVAVAPFATSAQGSMSPALPPTSNSPFAGVAPKNSVTLNFSLQDIYGNAQEIQAPFDSLTIPVGYYTDITPLNRWPGMACSYEVLPGGNSPQIKLQLNMQVDKYLPSASVTVKSAQDAASGDLASYNQIYYQIQQPDLTFALETSLNSASISSDSPVYPINPRTPFTAFVNAAYIFLNALQSLKQFVYTCAGTETVGNFFTDFGVTAEQLFEANAGQAYSALFGQTPLSVPTMYPTIQDDTLSTVSALYGLTPLALATNNGDVPLNPGIALAAPNRPYKVHDGYNLQQIAIEWRCTITGIAEANHDIQNILKPGNIFTVEGVPQPVGNQDTFDSMVLKFANDPNKPLQLTVSELAEAVAETVSSIFIDEVTLQITEIVAQQSDAATRTPYTVPDNYSLKQIAQELNLSVIGIALASHNLLNILQPGIEISANNVSLPVGPDDTFDSMAQALESLSKLPVTVADVAVVNQALPGIFRDAAVLQVTQRGDSFNSLASDYAADGFTIEALVNQTNEALPNIFAPGTPLFITANPVPPQKNDTLSSYASNNKVTTDQLAQHNAQATFASGAQLDIPSLVLNKSTKEYPIYVADGTETLEKIAEIFPPLDAVSLVTLNRNVPGLVAPGVTITVQYDQQTFSVTAAPADTFNSLLAKFAAQGATLSLVDLALDLAPQPDLLAKDGVWLCAQQYSSYVARGTDTLNGIAGNYPNLTPTLLAILNQDIQGLFAPNQTIEDPQSQKSIVTAGTDSFNSLLGKFAAQGVTLLLADLVSDMAPQQNLLQPLAVWIAPPMVAANSFAVGTENTLAGLATKYNLDMGSLAQANASVQGFLASDVKLTYEGQSFETNANETFNSLIARIGQAGFTATVSDLAAAFENVNGLLNPTSLIVPLPAPTQTSLDLTTPKFSDAIFALTVDVVMRRDTDCVDPDFVTVTSVYEARTPIAPESTPSGNNSALSLVEFAANFESALPGLHVASGKAASENDSDMERQLWAVNFGSSLGPQINYKFGSGDKMQFFAVPPLSTSLMSDTAQIIPYASGVGLTGPAQTMNFQSIDLDVWANTFLQAVDLFLSPSYAVPAYALQTTPGVGQKLTPYENVVEQKGVLAQAISEQVEYILQQPGNIDADALPDARAALKQALLVQLSNAYSINSMVQVPVQVQSNYDSSHASLAPRLSGQPANSLKVAGATNTEPINITSPQHNLATGDMVIISGVLGNVAANGDWTVTVIDENTFSLNGSNGTTSQPYVQNSGTITVETARVNDFSLSTAKVPLVNGTDRATFLFTVKSPADNKQANLTLQYVINQLEVPTTEAATIDDYQASNWLTFILPLADQNSAIGQVTIPIPLRSYPSPVTLVGQTGEQSYPQPSTAEELYNWNYSFVYQHLDADQDTTCLKVQFNTGGGSLAKAINMPGLFDALAQFIAVYPQLKDDLALLPLIAPGTTNNTALVAIQTFSQLVENVAGAWGATPAALRRSAKGMAQPPYNYTLQREKSETAPSQLSKLIIIADENNVSELWPEVEVYLNDEFQPLIMELTPPGSKQAIYDYPAGVLAESSLQYRMTFQYLNVTNTQDGWAGVSITRNADLVQTAQTNTDFIYQTPLTYFSSVMIPFIYGSVDIDIKNSPTIGLAQALGQFFQTLLSCNPDLPAGTTRNIRVACNYGYQLAAPTTQGLSERRALPGLRADGNSNPLVSFMPVILIPSYPFDLSKSYNWQDPNSFVSRLADAVATWQDNNQPSTTNGAFFFDISLFSTLDPSSLQPLLEAPFVRYVLDESGKI
jgi:LysM repeat protein